jgi:hypothetical protein
MSAVDDTWDRLAAAGGRLLQDLCGGHGSYMQEIFRFDYPGGGVVWMCRPCWSSTYMRLARPPQSLLTNTT